jgi:PAS domain S-box-containing protein
MKPATAFRPLPFAATWLSYAGVALLSLWLAVPPVYAAPLYPAAGIALAMLLRYGWSTLPAVGLASLSINLLWQWLYGHHGPGMVVPLALACGATLQAAVAATLVRRFIGAQPALSEPREIARFFALGALLANTVGATVALLTLSQAQVVLPGNLALTWWNWWIGDTLGVLIAAPLVLTLVGLPRQDWAPRRAWLGIPLLLATALLAGATAHSNFIEQRRALGLFERDAAGAADAVAAELQLPLHALKAMHGLFLANDELTANGLAAAALQGPASYWLQRPFHLRALGWAQRLPRTDVATFERSVQAESGRPDFRVFDRADALPEVQQEAEVIAIRGIEPAQGNTAALGLNVMSVTAARAAVAATRRSGEPRATPGFRLTQETEKTGTGIVLYQAVYRGQPTTDAERDAAFVGVLFVTLRMEEAVNSVMRSRLPRSVRWCLLDTDSGAPQRQLAGSADCSPRSDDEFSLERPLSYGGRDWLLRLRVPPIAVAPSLQWNGVLFSLVGLLATAMLSALLLSVTGRTRRIEVAVAQRTADLGHEVQERQRTEAALRESESRLRNILDNVPLGVVYIDLEGAIEEANPTFREMSGYTASELRGMNILRLAQADEREDMMATFSGMIDGDLGPQRRRWHLVRRDGSSRLMQSTTSPLRDPQGRPQRLVGVMEDVSEQARLEQAERARESAEAANRAKSEFVSRMSHELRTPLNAMLGFAQLLGLDRQQPLSASQLEWTAQIQQAGWHLLHMINDTLDLSRIESGTVKLDLQPVELAEMVAATQALVEQAAQRRRLTLSAELEPRAPAVLADATRLKQILTNLLSNAVKYNVDGGSITVLSRLVDAHTVEIEVRDSGIGMDSAQMAELFQPFNRLGRESFGEGTGIGLVISRRLAELMGGTLDAHSEAGEGSRFVLTLPRAPLDHPAASRPAPLTALPSDYRQRIVHYIEDNETNAEVMRGILAQRPQVRLEVSGNGLDGLAAIHMQPPSLVLLDMHLPDIDGLELLHHLKADPHTADIPVIVVSADATVARMEEAMQAGAVHYITKPVNVGDMLATLDELLETLDTRFG